MVRVSGYRSRGLGFHSWGYQIFWVVVGLERGPRRLVSTIEELLGRNSSDSGLENREYGRENPLRWLRYTIYPQKLTLTSPICGGRSVGIVRFRTKTTEFVRVFVVNFFKYHNKIKTLNVLWLADPLLGNDRQATKQRSLLGSTFLTSNKLQHWGMVFSELSLARCYNQERLEQQFSCGIFAGQ
jgi:hypothetical protein